MNIKVRYGILVLLAILITIMLYVFLLTRNVNYEIGIQANFVCNDYPKFSLASHLNDSIKHNIKEDFPYSIYIDSANWCMVVSVKDHLRVLSKFINDSSNLNQQIISFALTKKLEEKFININPNLNLDSLLMIIQWAEKFKIWAGLDESTNMFSNSVYGHWMNFASNELCAIYDKRPDIKYEPKFKYINMRLKEHKFGCSVNKSNLEKVVDNFVDKDYPRIIDKFFTRASITQKSVIILFIGYIIYSLFIVFKYHSLKSNK